jgi:hypothetical protein
MLEACDGVGFFFITSGMVEMIQQNSPNAATQVWSDVQD